MLSSWSRVFPSSSRFSEMLKRFIDTRQLSGHRVMMERGSQRYRWADGVDASGYESESGRYLRVGKTTSESRNHKQGRGKARRGTGKACAKWWRHAATPNHIQMPCLLGPQSEHHRHGTSSNSPFQFFQSSANPVWSISKVTDQALHLTSNNCARPAGPLRPAPSEIKTGRWLRDRLR